MQTSHQLDLQARYLSRACERLREALPNELVGVYAGGSYALGNYVRGRSDLDLAAVVAGSLPRRLKERIMERLRHESLPCPARRLELVIYRRDVAQLSAPSGDFELNLNTGATMGLQADYDTETDQQGSHWFAIDRSILAQAGIPPWGPPTERVFARIPPSALRPVLVDSVRWNRLHGGQPSDAVLNACRALRYAADGRWSSKVAAGRWASERGVAPAALVDDACRARTELVSLDGGEVDRFLRAAESRLVDRPD